MNDGFVTLDPIDPSFSAAERRGAILCREITRQYARTFYLASHCLPSATRAHAYAIYGFCRWADNGVDEAADLAKATARLDQARRALDLTYGEGPVPDGLAALRRTVRERGVPRDLFVELLNGMTMDLTVSRYEDFAALKLYCYRVAGVVGLMMTHVFGFRDDRCLPRAEDLGTAMQLTNILRDVGEDLQRGRVYLPQDEMAQFGVDEDQLREGRMDDRFRDLMRFQIERARSYYASANEGVADLIGSSSRLTVRVMGRLYGAILEVIEQNEYDVFRRRARVSGVTKARLVLACQAETFAESLHGLRG